MTTPERTPVVFAISGKRGVGKDTLADAVVARATERGVPLVRCAFATECKRAFVEHRAAEGEALSLEGLVHDRAYKEAHRPALTAFTERELARDALAFVRRVLARIGAGPGLVTDLRLRVELDALRARSALVAVRVERPRAHREASGWVFHAPADEHFTETQLDDERGWSAVLVNGGSLEAWRARGAELAERL